MTRPTDDEVWLQVAEAISRKSRCSRAHVGAVIVNKQGRIVATGYNGPPAGYVLTSYGDFSIPECGHWCIRGHHGPVPETVTSYEDCPSIHAELNALLYVDRTACEGGTIYITGEVCFTCAKAVANSGLARVVVAPTGADYRNPERSLQFMRDCGLEVRSL